MTNFTIALMSYKSYCKNVIGRFCCWPFVRQNYLNKCGMDHPKNICKQNNGKTVKARVFLLLPIWIIIKQNSFKSISWHSNKIQWRFKAKQNLLKQKYFDSFIWNPFSEVTKQPSSHSMHQRFDNPSIERNENVKRFSLKLRCLDK